MNLDRERALAKINAMPETSKEFLSAEWFEKEFDDLSEKYSLSDALDERSSLRQLILLLVAGVIKPIELREGIDEYLSLADRDSKKLADELLTALKPVLPAQTLAPSFSSSFTGKVEDKIATPRSAGLAMTQVNAPQGETLGVSKETHTDTIGGRAIPTRDITADGNKIASAEPRNDTQPAPFIIHERSGTQPTIASGQSFNASRPTFIRPQFTPSTGSRQAPAMARVQFGDQVISSKRLSSDPRVVNYSSPRIEEPKSKVISQTSKAPDSKSIVDDSNTINLRDLPR